MIELVLVTGGSGLVGSAIKRVAKEFKSFFVDAQMDFVFTSSKDYDLELLKDCQEMFDDIQPKYVIHLAACVGGLFKNMNNKVEMFEKNMMINHNVIKCCHDFGVKKTICCLSTCIFPDNIKYPISEEDLFKGPPHNSNDAYAYAKRMIEVQSQAYRDDFGDNFISIIPTNIYGPNDNFSLENGHVVPSLIHKCYLAKQTHDPKGALDEVTAEPFTVRGTGKPLRQFLYSDDLAKIILKILFAYTGNDTIIISPSEEHSIGELAESIASAVGYDKPLKYDSSYSDGQFKKTADNSKLMKFFVNDTFKFTSLEDGLKETVKWFEENYPNVRK